MRVENGWSVVGGLRIGGLGEVLKGRSREGWFFAAKFPKEQGVANQMMIDDEERRLLRHQGDGVVKHLGRVRLPDGREGYAMELMAGDLCGVFPWWRRGLAPTEVVDRLRPVAKVLAEIHAADGAFHGDLKLANILVRGRETKLADFGLARGGLGQTVMVGPHGGGTPGYFPPEGFASAQGDVYSLGAVFWALLVGREPSTGEALRIKMLGNPAFENLVNRMLAQVPGERPSMFEVGEGLTAVAAEAKARQRQAWQDLGKLGIGVYAAVAAVLLLKGLSEG